MAPDIDTIAPPAPGAAPAIDVRGITKRFGAVVAVDRVDLSVPAGSVLGLLGPNGAGKTTIVRMLTTLLRPDEGTARVLGYDVSREPDRVRASIGLAGQNAAVDENLTGRENLLLVGRLTHLTKAHQRERAAELLELFDLTDAAGRPAKTYSGGMRRRLDLAAALIHRPPVLFLDEPTTGLDPRSRTELWVVIEQLVADGATVLLTTQYLDEADRLAHRIAVVDHGRVIADGTAAELKARFGTTIVTVALADLADVARATTALEPYGRTAISDDHRSIDVRVLDGTRSLLGVVRALDGLAIGVDDVTIREPSLDDVFLELTGHTAELETEGASR